MKTIGKLLIATGLALGATACADYYGDDYGYNYSRGYDYGRPVYRDWDRGVVHDGARRYCRQPDGSLIFCGMDYD